MWTGDGRAFPSAAKVENEEAPLTKDRSYRIQLDGGRVLNELTRINDFGSDDSDIWQSAVAAVPAFSFGR